MILHRQIKGTSGENWNALEHLDAVACLILYKLWLCLLPIIYAFSSLENVATCEHKINAVHTFYLHNNLLCHCYSCINIVEYLKETGHHSLCWVYGYVV